MSNVIRGTIKKTQRQDFEPTIKVKIGGKEEFDFLIDTGCSTIVMAASILDRLSAEVNDFALCKPSQDKEKLGIVGDTVVDGYVFCGTVEIGGIKLYKEIYGIVGESQNLLGRSALKEFKTILNKDQNIQLEY